MSRNIGTFRTKTRYKFKKEPRAGGKMSVNRFFQEFKIGDSVNLTVEPAYQKGMYFPRFMGRTGVVTGKKRICYEVHINDKGKDKTLIVHPIHLTKAI